MSIFSIDVSLISPVYLACYRTEKRWAMLLANQKKYKVYNTSNSIWEKVANYINIGVSFTKLYTLRQLTYNYICRKFFLAIMQEPITPAFSFSLDNTIFVSLFTRLSEYFNIADLIEWMKYSPVIDSIPPTTTSSGLKMFISPAMACPSLYPIDSTTSMHKVSSLHVAVG